MGNKRRGRTTPLCLPCCEKNGHQLVCVLLCFDLLNSFFVIFILLIVAFVISVVVGLAGVGKLYVKRAAPEFGKCAIIFV